MTEGNHILVTILQYYALVNHNQLSGNLLEEIPLFELQLDQLCREFHFTTQEERELIRRNIEGCWCNIRNNNNQSCYDVLTSRFPNLTVSLDYMPLTFVQVLYKQSSEELVAYLNAHPGEATLPNECGITPIQFQSLYSKGVSYDIGLKQEITNLLIANGADVLEEVTNPLSKKYLSVYEFSALEIARYDYDLNPNLTTYDLPTIQSQIANTCYGQYVVDLFFRFPSPFMDFTNPEHFSWVENSFAAVPEIVKCKTLMREFFEKEQEIHQAVLSCLENKIILRQTSMNENSRAIEDVRQKMNQTEAELHKLHELDSQETFFSFLFSRFDFPSNDFYLSNVDELSGQLEQFLATMKNVYNLSPSCINTLTALYTQKLQLKEEIKRNALETERVVLEKAQFNLIECAKYFINERGVETVNSQGQTILHMIFNVMNAGQIVDSTFFDSVYKQVLEFKRTITTDSSSITIPFHRNVYSFFQWLATSNTYTKEDGFYRLKLKLGRIQIGVAALAPHISLIGENVYNRTLELIKQCESHIHPLPKGNHHLFFTDALEEIALYTIDKAFAENKLNQILQTKDKKGSIPDTINRKIIRHLASLLNKHRDRFLRNPTPPLNVHMSTQVHDILLSHDSHERGIIDNVIDYLKP